MPTRDWPRLARYVRDRRNNLGLTQEEVAARGGPSTATIRNIETGEQGSYRAKSLREIAEALGWTTGSPLAILNGREPQDATRPEPARPDRGRFRLIPGDSGQFRARGTSVRAARDLSAATADAAAELAAIIGAAEARNPGAAGADIFADPTLAGIWDLEACSRQYRLILMGAYVIRRRSDAEDRVS